MKKFIKNVVAGFALCTALSLPLVSCANFTDSDSDSYSIVKSVEYGSITINGSDSASRALDVSTITSATVTVSGYGMEDIVKNDVEILGGKACGVTIEKIPVGRRVITVKSNVDGAVMRAVCDIATGSNSVTVNWASTAVGNVYYNLIKGGTDVSALAASVFSGKIPTVHASLFDAGKFAADLKTANLNVSGLNADDYILGYGNIAVNYTNTSGYTVQVTDIASEKTTFSQASGNATLKGYPGEWKVKVFDDAGNLKETKDVVVAAGKTTKITINHISGSEPVTGKIVVHVPSSLNYPNVYAWKDNSTTYTESWPGTSMGSASNGYYSYTLNNLTVTKIIFNKGTGNQTKDLYITEGEWNYIGGASGTADTDGSKISSNFEKATVEESLTVTVENPALPVAPTATISPLSGEISVNDSITVTLTNGNDTISAASVTVSGEVSKTYSYSDFTNDVLTIKVGEGGLGITEADKSISVSASVTNGVSTVSAEPKSYTTTVKTVVKDTFTWDNANVYFVIQDRFFDGDSSNNNSYGRMSKDELNSTIGTFHGGDIKGLTEKLDYLNGLGINAIWITAAYEQAHGWCGGGSSGDFAHYGYHGYYPLDYTMIDKNMGTVKEFRDFVTECHKRGIRVVMDVVMNHTGYLTLQDCQDYSIDIFKGSYTGGKSTDMGFKIGSDGNTYHAHHDKIDYSGHNDGWAKWWGSSWVRAGVPGYGAGGGDDLTQNLNNLPDVKTENQTAQKVAPILQTKWAKETSGYDDWIIPAAKDLRSDSATNAPAVWIEKWLAAWVEEFGIDGFRCDTAKHVDMCRWGELKVLCKTALAKWRASNRADEYAKDWDEEFWMTGECFGWKYGNGGNWFSTGGFDTMIDFSVADKDGMGTYTKDLPSWSSRTGNHQGLLYISSHDTGLLRSSDQKTLGTQFVLMPGPIQIYYGDETCRQFGDTGSDPNQGTRSDFNWDAANGDCAKHWGKLGTFRNFNPAVGAGSISGDTRTCGDNKIVISTSSTNVTVPYPNGTTVYNWYDGKSATVQNGSATFNTSSASTSAPVLCSDRNPADYGVSF